MLQLKSFYPSPHLKPFVQRYILTKGIIPPGTTIKQLLIPGLTEILYFNLEEHPQCFTTNETAVAVINGQFSGQLTHAFEGSFSGFVKLLGVHMHTPALYQLLGVPMGPLLNRGATLEEVLGSQHLSFGCELRELKSMRLVIKQLEAFLTRLLDSRKTAHSAVLNSLYMIKHAVGKAPVKEMAAYNKISERGLQKTFLNQVGMTPKAYCRMYRFNEVVKAINSNQFSWRYVVDHLGYYDQAHFLNDFKSITGITPSNYLPLHPYINKFITDYKP